MCAPFNGKQFTFTQPDGSELWVKGWGNQDHAVFECLNGYTVVKDPNTGFYVYADISPDAEELRPTNLQPRMSETKPKDFGLASGLRMKPEAAKAMAMKSSPLPVGKSRWQQRRDEAKAARRREVEMAAKGMAAGAPSRQTINDFTGLCLLIEFSDDRGTIPQEEVEAFCNQPGYSGFGNNGSVFDYFFDVSDGNLRYNNIVTPYYMAKQPKSYYTDPSIPQADRAQELIVEALDHFKAQGFDFSGLTADDWGYVYAVNAFYAGTLDNEWAKGLWPHQSFLSSGHPLVDDKQAYDYQITDMGSELSLGVFCHENGHMLCEFPDLYAYADKEAGVGSFCLMCGGGNADPKNPTHVNPYLKYRAGWAESVTMISTEQQAAVPAGTNQFFIYRKGGTVATEYYIIENRLQAGRDEALPGSGLAIWHIDELGDNTGWDPETIRNNECTLVQADGRSELESRVSDGDATDLFASDVNDHFGRATNPNSAWWDGTPSGLEINTISEAGAMMTFTAVNPGDGDTSSDPIEQPKETIPMLIITHKVGPGESLGQIAEMYGTTYQQIAQDNDIAAEIADDNDLTDAFLTINLSPDVISMEWFDLAFNGRYDALSNCEEGQVEDLNWQLDGFLNQCIDILQRKIANHAIKPPLNQEITYTFHTARSAWDYFRNMDFQWNMELSNLGMTPKDYETSEYLESTRMMGLTRSQLMAARVAQLILADIQLSNL